MKIIKSEKYKLSFEFNSRKELAYKLLDWHGGQWSPLYSVGSSWSAGKDVPREIVEQAIQELEDNIQGIISKQTGLRSNRSKDIAELRNLQGMLKNELEKIGIEDSDYPTDTPLGEQMDDNPVDGFDY